MTETRPVNKIADEIISLMYEENIDIPEMMPYLNAMQSITDIQDSIGYDSGEMIVKYFIMNAKKWKSKKFALLRQELKGLVK